MNFSAGLILVLAGDIRSGPQTHCSRLTRHGWRWIVDAHRPRRYFCGSDLIGEPGGTSSAVTDRPDNMLYTLLSRTPRKLPFARASASRALRRAISCVE